MVTERVGKQLGHYQLLRLLGRGGFADVYLGEHIHLKSPAAIKVLHARLTEDLQESFLNEARILARLSHPHIIRILDFGIEDDAAYLVMDYAPQGSLRQGYLRNTKLPLATVIGYVQQIADGLQYAHEQKLIHRDLKPDNVLIGQKGELLLSDFGVALNAHSTQSREEADRTLVGTASYMAPEQLQGKPQFASDQYALGIMVYEWLCGTRPFQGTLIELYNQHYSTPPRPLREHVPELPEAVEQVVLRALAKDPAQRYASVQEFAQALERAGQISQGIIAWPTAPLQGSSPVPAVPGFVDVAKTVPISASMPGIAGTFQQSTPSQPTFPTSQPTWSPLGYTPRSKRPLMIAGRDLRKSFTGRKFLLPIGLALLMILVVASASLYAFSQHSSSPTGIAQTATGKAQGGHTTMPAPDDIAATPTGPSTTPTPGSMPAGSTQHIANPAPNSTAPDPTAAPAPTQQSGPTTQSPPAPRPTPTPVPQPTPTPKPPPVCPAQVQSGSTGSLVRTVQSTLNARYNSHVFPNSPYNFSPPLQVDGDFGPLTDAAVKDFQKAKGLQVDGQVGPKTWHALGYC